MSPTVYLPGPDEAYPQQIANIVQAARATYGHAVRFVRPPCTCGPDSPELAEAWWARHAGPPDGPAGASG